MPWRYSAFGLSIETDRPVPGLAESKTGQSPDLRVDTIGPRPGLRESGWRELYVSPTAGLGGSPLVRISSSSGDEFVRFQYDDGADFLIDGGGSKVWATWPGALTMDDIAPYLSGPILGFVLRLRGRTSLHASAVIVHGRAVAFVGPAGAGKSTTAAAFARRGHAVLTEDIVTLSESDEGFGVLSGYPWIRLWPASVEALFGSKQALPRISPADPEWDKCFLDLAGGDFSFASEAVPLGAIYILAKRTAAAEAPRIEQRSAVTRLFCLIEQTYSSYVPDKRVEARGFEMLGRVARSVPVRIVAPHVDIERLERLCDVVLDDYASLAASSTDRPVEAV